MDKLKLKYLYLLAATQQNHQVLWELKKGQYPIDECLEICEKYRILDAQAYLLVKAGGQGHISAAISLYFQVYISCNVVADGRTEGFDNGQHGRLSQGSWKNRTRVREHMQIGL